MSVKFVILHFSSFLSLTSNHRRKSTSSAPLPEGWSIQYTPENRQFFVNKHLKISTWNDPRLAAGEGSKQQQQQQQKLNSKQSLRSLPPGWEEAFDEDGYIYYIDHNTKTTQRECPLTEVTMSPPVAVATTGAMAEMSTSAAKSSTSVPATTSSSSSSSSSSCCNPKQRSLTKQHSASSISSWESISSLISTVSSITASLSSYGSVGKDEDQFSQRSGGSSGSADGSSSSSSSSSSKAQRKTFFDECVRSEFAINTSTSNNNNNNNSNLNKASVNSKSGLLPKLNRFFWGSMRRPSEAEGDYVGDDDDNDDALKTIMIEEGLGCQP